jgi:hypothetical protein
MTQTQALVVLAALIVVLFAGIYWLGHIVPTSDSPGDDGSRARPSEEA